SSVEFGYILLPAKFCTGSSIMPQKLNPDPLELIRGQSATGIGAVTSVLTLMKALPLGYNRDVQEDKHSWFTILDCSLSSLEILSAIVSGMTPVAERMKSATRYGHITATEYANQLVRQGVSFRDAHHVVGRLVLEAEGRGKNLDYLDEGDVSQA